MAAIVSPARASAEHQSLLHFVGQAAWSGDAMLAKVRELVLPSIEAHGEIEAWLVDGTGFVKKGVHSVGVARQYCGRQCLTAQNWQNRKLSDRSDPAARQSCVQSACGVSVIFAQRMDG